MIDYQQEQLIETLKIQADKAELSRDKANFQHQIAVEKQKEPNRFILKNQSVALAIAGILSIGGIFYSNASKSPMPGILGTGTGLAIGLVSNYKDDERQTREKQQLLLQTTTELTQTEETLQSAVTIYTEEDEKLWIMYNLEINRTELSNLHDWMSDIRRNMKDDILQAIDILIKDFSIKIPNSDMVNTLYLESKHRHLRNQLLSKEFQMEKKKFINNIYKKYHIQKTTEQNQSQAMYRLEKGATIVVGGTTAGLVAGAGTAALTYGAVKAMGVSRETSNLVATLGGAAAVMGIGWMAAKAIGNWFSNADEERKQLEQQYFNDSFVITERIFQEIKAANLANGMSKQNHLVNALNIINEFQNQQLKTQDQQLKDYVNILKWQLQAGIISV